MALNKTQTALKELGLDYQVYTDTYEGADSDTITSTCGKCSGYGRIAAFSNVEGGRCFECDGRGSWQTALGTLRRRRRDKVNRDNLAALKAARQNAELDVKRAQFNKACPGVADQVAAMAAEGNSFAASLDAALHRYGSLTDNQVRAFQDMVEKIAQEKAARAAATPVPAGRTEVTGTVLSVKWTENNFSYHATGSWKMVVQDERGFRVYGTVPRALDADSIKGTRVTFTATLEQSTDDETFGFFKRPTKASAA